MNTTTLDSEPAKLKRSATETAREFVTGQETENRTGTGSDEKKNESNPSTKSNRGFRVGLTVAGVAAVMALTYAYEKFVAPYESTDDAFIEGDATPIAPQVAGQVVQLLVNDNQEVKQGEVLVRIDAREYQAKADQARASLEEAKGRLEQANAQCTVDEAKVEQEKANVIAAEAESNYAAADAKRDQAVGNIAVSRSQQELADTQAKSTAAQVDAARSKEFAAEAQAKLDKANIGTATAEIERDEAAERQADLELSYTEVTAPVAGFITHRTVDNGAYVEAGQNLLAVMPREVWIVANFKETQLKHMRPGQPVEVRVDAYPQVKFQGRVDSIQAGTGARFSLLPAENATGNYVKVVERVPVKILLDGVPDGGCVLGAGMSVEPKVRVN